MHTLVRWLEEENEKENQDPKVISPDKHFPIVANVRGLVDDEAEDEDDDDDSVEDEGDDRQETAGELQDLLTQDAGEKPGDIKRRAGLHAKWLEQQDLAMEDSILHRIESGWKKKAKKEMPALLSIAQEGVSKGDDIARPFSGIDGLKGLASGDFVSPLEVLKKHARGDVDLPNRAAESDSLDQDSADPVTQDDYQESSDDEGAEENLHRQLFLQESVRKPIST